MQTMPQEVMPQEPMPEEEAALIQVEVEVEDEEERKQRLARRQARLDSVALGLGIMFDEAVTWRQDAEHQWLIDLAQYEAGQVDLKPTKDDSGSVSGDADYRRTGDNITRPAVLLMTSRVSDMLFPTSDRNWDITPSPNATISQPIDPYDAEGNPLTEDQVESAEQKVAEERCAAMRTTIDDQLQESNYSGVGRDAIFDGTLYGTGVIRGPFPRNKLCRKPDKNGHWKRSFEDDPTATVAYVDLFQFYPRPCRNITECPGVFELHLMTTAKLRELADEPGFSRTQVARVVRDGSPKFGALAKSALFMRANINSNTTSSVNMTLENRYPVVCYSGEMKREEVIDFTQGLIEEAKIDEEQAAEIIAKLLDNDLISVNCEVWFVSGITIKLVLRPVDDNLPLYHVYNYEKRPDSVFGKGLPFVLREDQLAAQQLWQAMMLNAMMSAGSQIAVNKGALEPMGPNGKTYDLTFTRPRVWAFTDEAVDITKAFQAWNVPNVIDKLMPMYERAKSNGQEHALLPAIAQGDATSAVPTSSGLSMLMNAANIVTRQLAKAWDDDVTNPLINAFYDWNLEHGPDNAKGDYVVIPRGVSHLLVKDVQAQRYLFALQTYSANPEMMARMKWGEWARMGMTVMEMDSGKLLKDEKIVEAEQAAAAENPSQDPRVLAEQNAAKRLELEAANDQAINELKKMEIEMRERMAQTNAASAERVAQLNYLGHLAQLDKNERAEMAKLDTKIQSEGLWASLEAKKMQDKKERDLLEIQVESPNPRLA